MYSCYKYQDRSGKERSHNLNKRIRQRALFVSITDLYFQICTKSQKVYVLPILYRGYLGFFFFGEISKFISSSGHHR